MWTLALAKKDYKTSNPKCSKCTFSKTEDIYDYDPWYPRTYVKITCKVMEETVFANQATECKYYTVK